MSTTRFEYMVLTSYIRDEATMNHQGARIAQHLAEMDPPSIVTFRWEEPAGVTMIAEIPLSGLRQRMISTHYGATVIPL